MARPVRDPGRIALEGLSVEVVADLGRQDAEVATDSRDAVGVLHCADVVARLVAADRDRLLGDARGLGRETGDRGRLRLAGERIPAGPALDEPDRSEERGHEAETEHEAANGNERRARRVLLRLVLARLVLLEPVALEVDLLRSPVRSTPWSPVSERAHEEVNLEAECHEEDDQDGNRPPQRARPDDPREHEPDERDSHPEPRTRRRSVHRKDGSGGSGR